MNLSQGLPGLSCFAHLGTCVPGFVSLTQAAFGCAPLGRTLCGAQSRLPRHLRAGFIPLTPAAFGCAPRGRTSCGAQSRLPRHFVSRRSSSPRLFGIGELGVLFRSRRQPSAALRWGALCATAGRPCLGTSCLGLDHHYSCSGAENGLSEAKKAVRPVSRTARSTKC